MNIDFIGRFIFIRWSSAASSRWHPIGGVSCDRETFGSLSWRRRCEDALAHGSQFLYSDGKKRLTVSVRLHIHDAYSMWAEVAVFCCLSLMVTDGQTFNGLTFLLRCEDPPENEGLRKKRIFLDLAEFGDHKDILPSKEAG